MFGSSNHHSGADGRDIGKITEHLNAIATSTENRSVGTVITAGSVIKAEGVHSGADNIALGYKEFGRFRTKTRYAGPPERRG